MSIKYRPVKFILNYREEWPERNFLSSVVLLGTRRGCC